LIIGFIKFSHVKCVLFQIYKDDIDQFAPVLADKIDRLLDILKKSTAANTCKKYELAFNR
jgi:hypothetical protein